MTAKTVLILSILDILAGVSYGQISPGELTTAHANLEGMSNCTQCHTIGKSLSNARCLSCHKEINVRIKQGEGYHATVSLKMCQECHHEHFGRNYQIMPLDTATFNHSAVGFALTGKHKSTSCRQCHNTNNISAADVKLLPATQQKITYLGLSTSCQSCHEDIHKGQLSSNCSSCHTTERWKPADNFSHDRTNFVLTGKHRTTGCYQCHNQTLADGKTIKFTHMSFSSCVSCHADPHKGEFKQPCSSCHTTETFVIVAKAEFDHSKTLFPLRGKHADLKCSQCHSDNPMKKNISGELGFHITKFQACSDCHADAHAGQFADRDDGGKCDACHIDAGFKPAEFSIDDHQKTRYILTGAHKAVACNDCHQSGKVNAQSKLQFRWKGEIDCTTCHSNIHGGQFVNEMARGCVTCHTTVSWQSLLFSHEKTRFPLRGKHAEIACSKCHTQPAEPLPVQYVGLDMKCSSCHADEHKGQFMIEGFTDCGRCHTAENWTRTNFDHDTQSSFPLTGKHIGVACEKCHPTVLIDGKRTARYRPIGTKCIDCHSA
ncbi:MAG TPA: cytochrome C [Candidatus Kryptonia bacterium]